MPDVAVNPLRYQCGGFFEGVQAFIAAQCIRFSAGMQYPSSLNNTEPGTNKKYPGYNLIPGKRISEPGSGIEQEQNEDQFPGKEAEKAVRAKIAQGFKGDKRNYYGCDDEYGYF